MTDVEADGSVTASRDGDVLRLTLDRPSRRNALSHSMIDALVDLLTEAATDDSLRAIHIRGAGSDFCAGTDWVATNSAGQRPRTGDLVRRIPAHRQSCDRARPWHPAARGLQRAGLGRRTWLQSGPGRGLHGRRRRRRVLEPFVGRGFSPDSGSTWLLPRLDRPGTGQGDAAARREGEWTRRCGLGADSPRRELGRIRRRH